MVKGEYTDHYVFQRPQKPNAWFMYQIFYIVANAETIEDASRETGLSHHYMSKIISRLENSMDVVLFKRGKTGLTLTKLGERAFEQLKSANGLIEKTTEILELGRHGIVESPLNIGASYAFGMSLLHPFVHILKGKYPSLRINLSLLDYDKQGFVYNYDCGIIFGKPIRQNYCADYLFSQEQGIYASEEYLKKNGTPKTLDDIVNSGNIIPIKRKNSPSVDRPKWMKLFHNNYEHGGMASGIIQTVLDRVLWNHGFGILPNEYSLAYPIEQVLQKECKSKAKDVYFIYPEAHKDNKDIQKIKRFLIDITSPIRKNQKVL